ncbi:Hypothetical predicted protein [Pelobates cultripes]|uniref:Uncharacterized protein n=1 Tax=Pelobates cultripes TaxID=61616 RepID=A0AAD1WUF5_PELCU|nr:Hypothetical predicted protein [Pelobates cultripes]
MGRATGHDPPQHYNDHKPPLRNSPSAREATHRRTPPHDRTGHTRREAPHPPMTAERTRIHYPQLHASTIWPYVTTYTAQEVAGRIPNSGRCPEDHLLDPDDLVIGETIGGHFYNLLPSISQ